MSAWTKTLSLVAAGSVVAAGWSAWNVYGSDVRNAQAQEQLAQALLEDDQPRQVNLEGHVVWHGPDALQQYQAPGSDNVPVSVSARPADPTMRGSGRDAERNSAQEALPAADGQAWGRIEIPAIGVDQVLVTGTSDAALELGPGVWRHGSVPGMPGNATISGHRTSHGGPFRELDELTYGDQIIIEVPGNPRAVYEVRGRAVVDPSDVSVTNDAGGARLTLTTCHPEHSTKWRLVVQAELIEGEHVGQATSADDWQLQAGS